MDAVKEAVLEQKIDDLTLRFEQAEERNREEHGEIRAAIRAETGGLRTAVRAEVGGLRAEVHEEIGALRAEVHDEIGGLRAEVHGEVGGLRAELHDQVGGLRAEMNEGFRSIHARIDTLGVGLQSFQRSLIVLFGSFLAAVSGAIVAAVLARLL